MDKATPSRPVRAKRTKFEPIPQPQPQPVVEDTGEPENKYAKRPRIGKPTMGTRIIVEKVGLGKLRVQTATGIQQN